MSRCSLDMSDLWVCMRDVISEFNSEIEGSHTSCALMLFLCSILCLICSGSSLHVECNYVDNDVCEVYICYWFHCSTHCFPTSWNVMRSFKEQGCAGWEHCNICAMVYSALPHAHVVSPVYPFLCSSFVFFCKCIL